MVNLQKGKYDIHFYIFIQNFMTVVILAIATLLAIADQVIKYFVRLNLKPIGTVEVIQNFFSLSYLENTGVAFGLLKNMSWLYIPMTIVGCGVIIVMLFRYKHHTFWSYSAITLILAGGIGNLVDRIVLGYVVDFFNVHFFPFIFNFADCCVVVGAILFVIAVLTSTGDKHKDKNEKDANGSDDELKQVE